MESDLGPQLLTIVLLILVNAFFAMAEMAMVSANKVRIGVEADKGNPRALKLQKYSKDPVIFFRPFKLGLPLPDSWHPPRRQQELRKK